MKKPKEKDYKENVGICGGYMKDMPKPYIYLFPNKYKKRTLEFNIHTYFGFSIGAKHYFSTYYLKHNGVWNGETWVEPWDFKDCNIYFIPLFKSTNKNIVVQKIKKWIKENADKYNLNAFIGDIAI